MTDTQYKVTALAPLEPTQPATDVLRPNTLMYWSAMQQVGSAQDAAVAGSRRVVGRWGMSGSPAFHVTASGAPTLEVATNGSYPDRDTWRSGGTIYVPRVTPGCFLRARVYFVPSGNTQYESPSGTWNPAGPFGAVRLSDTWTYSGGSDGPFARSAILPVSTLPNAEIPTDEAGFWLVEDYVEIGPLRPDDIDTDSVMVNYTEDVSCSILVELQGAPRIVNIVVYEEPIRAVYLNSNAADKAVNGMSAYEAPQTETPAEEDADGATYAENRFGTHALIGTADRQQDVLGPVITQFVGWNESTQDFHNAGFDPIVLSNGTGYADLIDQTQSTYDRTRPGWIVAASHAQVHRLCDTGLILSGDSAVIPGRVTFEARKTSAGATAHVIVQSGEFEWIRIDITSTSFATYNASGFFESQVSPDHAWAVLQVFGEVSQQNLEFRAFAAGYAV